MSTGPFSICPNCTKWKYSLYSLGTFKRLFDQIKRIKGPFNQVVQNSFRLFSVNENLERICCQINFKYVKFANFESLYIR